MSGITLGLIQWALAHQFDPAEHWGFGELPEAMVIFAALAFGSLFGDMLGSFIKRRLGIGKGAKAPVLDQYDFVIGAFLFVSLASPEWVWESFIEGEHILALVTFLVVIPIVHRAVNIIGYRMGKKDVPW
jgi:CDP-2,3-bis-(O-geranylgeranyl)-sn-glycerol synthase